MTGEGALMMKCFAFTREGIRLESEMLKSLALFTTEMTLASIDAVSS